jgi:hypothetical protein
MIAATAAAAIAPKMTSSRVTRGDLPGADGITSIAHEY